jgi:signal transduction histidine kinase
MSRALMRGFDQSLQGDARLLTTMVEQTARGIRLDFDAEQAPTFVSARQNRFFELLGADGAIIARSPSLSGRDLSLPHVEGDATMDMPLPGGRMGRAYAHPFQPHQDDEGESRSRRVAVTAVLVVAGDPQDVRQTMRTLGQFLFGLCAATVVLMAGLLYWIASTSIRPLGVVAASIGAIDETNLAFRLRMKKLPDELTPIVDKLNGLLRRLEDAFAREKGFTADAAHELRTPLAGLVMTLDVCRSRPRQPAEFEAAIDDCRAILDRMTAMVQSLLLLARSESGQQRAERREVEAVSLVHDLWAPLEPLATRRGLAIAWSLPEQCTLNTDPEQAAVIIRNLLGNAVAHADEHGSVRVELRATENGLVLTIANTGSMIPSQDIPHLFERFWRGDASRTDTHRHCGLGLSLCQRFATLLGGTINITSARRRVCGQARASVHQRRHPPVNVSIAYRKYALSDRTSTGLNRRRSLPGRVSSPGHFRAAWRPVRLRFAPSPSPSSGSESRDSR